MKKFIIAIILFKAATFTKADFSTVTALYNESKVDSLMEIIHHPEVTFISKMELVKTHNCLPLYTEYFDKLYSAYNKLLEDSYKYSDKESMFLCNCLIANLYFCSLDKANTERYLNLAQDYLKQVKQTFNLAYYYRISAQYIQRYMPDRMPDAVNKYQNSLSYYDKLKTKGKEDDIALILNNLSMNAFLSNDSSYISKSIKKLKEFRGNGNSPIVEFYYLNVTSTLHTVFYNFSSDDRYLDSTVFYLKKCLDLHDKGLLPKSFDYYCVDLYTIIAETFSMKRVLNNDVIDSLLAIAIKNDLDSMGMARVFQIKARTFFKRNMIDSTEVMALKSQSYLESGYQDNDYSLEKRNIDFLRAIYEIKGDYKQAIDYNYLWDKKSEVMRANDVKELELQFEVEMKDSELKRLFAEGLYHENRIKLYILTCALLCLGILFMVFFLQFKKRYLNSQLALIDAEREETKLKVKLKEEQTVKMQLEKFMALSDFRLKELELIGKTKDMEQLSEDKKELDKQVEQFRQKVEAYELSLEKETQQNRDLQHVIIEDLRRIFSRQMSSDHKYFEKLAALNKSFTDLINEKSDRRLSVSYLKYCVCFAIGMGTNEVADCFNIEQTSVHMIRYRLKKKFGLSNDDDLGRFLQEQVSNSD